MSVIYPLFAFEKDNNSMRLIESESLILRHLEAIDIEGDEYVFWDLSGGGVSVAVSVGRFKSKLLSVTSCPPVFPLRDALKTYAISLGLPETVADGVPMDAWKRIQADSGGKPKKRDVVSRLFAGKE